MSFLGKQTDDPLAEKDLEVDPTHLLEVDPTHVLQVTPQVTWTGKSAAQTL